MLPPLTLEAKKWCKGFILVTITRFGKTIFAGWAAAPWVLV
jgi:hypothetical protein